MKKIVFLVLMMIATNANAQLACDTRDNVVKKLKGYQEYPIGFGVAGAFIIELFVSDNGSWTMLRTAPGESCVIGYGSDWESIPKPKGPPL